MVKPFIFAVGILSVFMPTASYALSLKKQLPPIVILYPDGSYYTVAEGQNVFVTDYPGISCTRMRRRFGLLKSNRGTNVILKWRLFLPQNQN